MSDSEDYRLIKQLGDGLAGPVYLSETGSGQLAVRQFQSQSPAGSPGWTADRQHFLSASRQAAGLVQPRIVQIHEVIDEAGEAFVAMEYVPSDTLEPVLKRESFQPEQANYLLRRIASTLDYAHQKGVVHGDLKPSNIFVLPDRSIKLTDFAISPRARQDSGPLPANRAHAYISPEHFLDPQKIGPRSDQYALAAIAYHLYTGRAPFDEAGTDLRSAILSGDMAAASSIRRQLPRRLDAVLGKALSRDPGQRYASNTEFVDSLEAGLAPAEVPIPIAGSYSKALYAAAGLLAAVLLAALLFAFFGRSHKKPVAAKPQPGSVTAGEVRDARKDTPTLTPPVKQLSVGSTPAAAPASSKPSPAGPLVSPSTAEKKVIAVAPVKRPDQDDPMPVRTPPPPSTPEPSLDLTVFSRTRKLENGLNFSYGDPTLGELGHGDLKALVRATGALPKGKLTLDWIVDGLRMDSKQVSPNQQVEYGNEPTAGTYKVTLRLDAKELKTVVFRITP